MTDTYPPNVSFRRLMAVKETASDTFESIQLAWPPGIVPTRTFGGHVFAQAVYSASKTVANGMTVHNATGHFLLPGRSDCPFTYKVRRIRDGGVYCLRSVDVYQATEGLAAADPWHVERSATTPCFVVTASFKRDENGSKWAKISHQDAPADHIQKKYASVLKGFEHIQDHPRSPSADTQWYLDQLGAKWIEHAGTFPGVEIRKVDMSKYNGGAERPEGDTDRAGDWRQLCFYRVILDSEGPEPPDAHDAASLDAAAHIYASDRNSLFLIQRALGLGRVRASAGSLAHTVILNGSAQGLGTRRGGKGGEAKWFVQEAWTSNSGEGRGTHESRLWDWEEGRVLGTTCQDGMMRIPKSTADGKKEKEKKKERGGKL